MRVEELRIRNFRNIEDCVLFPASQLNFLVGLNGQGKTSFLEAISYLSTLRSFRNSKSEDAIQWGKQEAEVSCSLKKEEWKSRLRIKFSAGNEQGEKNSKTAFVNEKPCKSATLYLHQRFGSSQLGFHSVTFNPSDHELVNGDPSVRRGYLDSVLIAEEMDYIEVLRKYQRVLKQKNALLKDPRAEKGRPVSLFDFNESLARYGSLLTFRRLLWIRRLQKIVNDAARLISLKQAPLNIFYYSSWVSETENLVIHNKELKVRHFTGQEVVPSLKMLETSFLKALSAFEQLEMKVRTSLVGPHRDDWGLWIGERKLKAVGSQGEVRTALLALKISEIELFREKTGCLPVFLLDDFSSELDQERRKFLLNFFSKTDLQAFITSTEDSLEGGTKHFISDGRLREFFT